MEREFIPCEACLWLATRDRTHVPREVEFIAVLPEDTEYEAANVGFCAEHYAAHIRINYGQPMSGLIGGIQ